MKEKGDALRIAFAANDPPHILGVGGAHCIEAKGTSMTRTGLPSKGTISARQVRWGRVRLAMRACTRRGSIMVTLVRFGPGHPAIVFDSDQEPAKVLFGSVRQADHRLQEFGVGQKPFLFSFKFHGQAFAPAMISRSLSGVMFVSGMRVNAPPLS